MDVCVCVVGMDVCDNKLEVQLKVGKGIKSEFGENL